MSVSVWVSKIAFKTGFSGLSSGLGFHPGKNIDYTCNTFIKHLFIIADAATQFESTSC